MLSFFLMEMLEIEYHITKILAFYYRLFSDVHVLPEPGQNIINIANF